MNAPVSQHHNIDGGLQAQPSPLVLMLRELWRDKPATIGLGVMFIIVAVSLLAPFIAPYDPAAQSVMARLKPPVWHSNGTWSHILGTDNLGRDVLSRVIWGGRVTLFIGVATCALAAMIGITIGLWAGFLGGRVDSILMRIVDIQISFPGIMLILLVVSVVGPGVTTMIVVLSITNWMVYARLVRGTVLATRQTAYVDAAEVIGCKPGRIVTWHILPNLIAPLLTLCILEFTNIVLAEAAVSFLGFGVQPPATSWGLDVASGRDYLLIAWWLVTMPGLAIVLMVLSMNFFASWLRVTVDPEEREKRHAYDLMKKMRRKKEEGPIAASVSPVVADGEENTLVIDDLHIDFDTRGGLVKALRGVSFTIAPGETLGLVGESGSGKSITANAIMGLVDAPGRIIGGDVRWNGQSLVAAGMSKGTPAAAKVDHRAVWGRDIAMIFQNPMTSLNPLMNVGDHLVEVMSLHLGLDRAQALKRAEELLAAVGISSPRRRLSQYPYELSGGMRQRVMIALAISCNPKLLIADEPTTALDVTIQAQILELLAELQKSMGLSILLITHDMGIVAGLCHRVAVMYSGRIVETGDVDTIFEAPQHPYTQGLMRSTPSLDACQARLIAIEGAPPSLMTQIAGCSFQPRCPIAAPQCRQRPQLQSIRPGVAVACWKAGQPAWPAPEALAAAPAMMSGAMKKQLGAGQ